eukprot:COSAG05_NODE_2920_length_2509_cov_85.126141_5_plen_59_part_00
MLNPDCLAAVLYSAQREVHIPEKMDMYHLVAEVPPHREDSDLHRLLMRCRASNAGEAG